MRITKSFITAKIRGGGNTHDIEPMTVDTVAAQARSLSEWDFVSTFNSQVSGRQTAIREKYGLPQDATGYDVLEAAQK